MSLLGPTAIILALLAPTPDDTPRAGRLVHLGEPAGPVILVAPRVAWSPELVEGTEVCGPEDRCAAVASTSECSEPTCAFGFGTQYELADDVAELPPLPAVDDALLTRLEREPSLAPLVAVIREHWSSPPPSPPPEPLHPEPLHPEPMPIPTPPRGGGSRPRIATSEPGPPRPPSWIATPGWSFEATGVPLLGVAFGSDDDEHFGVGGVVTTGFRHQLEIPGKQRILGAAVLGNQFGADLDFMVVHAPGATRLGVGLDVATRTVYAPMDRSAPNRLRVFSLLDLLLPGVGVLFDLDGRMHPHLRLAAPVSILLRERVGLELRLDMNVMLREGPIAAYILLGAGVLLRQPWG